MIIQTSRRLATLAVLTGTVGVSHAQDDSIDVSFRLSPGEQAVYIIDNDQSMTQSVGGQRFSAKNDISQRLVMRGEPVEKGGSRRIKQFTDAVSISMNIPGMEELTYNSQTDEFPTRPELFGAAGLVGIEIDIELDRAGNVTGIPNLEETRHDLQTVFQDIPNPGIEGMLSEEGIRSMVEGNFGTYAGRPVRVGEAWNETIALPMPPFGKLRMDYALTLESIEGEAPARTAFISIDLEMRFEKDPGAMGQLAISNENSEGRAVYDEAMGVFSEIVLRTAYTITAGAEGQGAVSISMDNLIEQRLVDDDTPVRDLSSPDPEG